MISLLLVHFVPPQCIINPIDNPSHQTDPVPGWSRWQTASRSSSRSTLSSSPPTRTTSLAQWTCRWLSIMMNGPEGILSLSLIWWPTYNNRWRKNLIPLSRAWSATSVESSTAARRRCSPIVNGFSTTASFSTRLPGAAEQNHNSKSHSKIGRWSKTKLITLFKCHFPLSKLTSIAKGLVKVSWINWIRITLISFQLYWVQCQGVQLFSKLENKSY